MGEQTGLHPPLSECGVLWEVRLEGHDNACLIGMIDAGITSAAVVLSLKCHSASQLEMPAFGLGHRFVEEVRRDSHPCEHRCKAIFLQRFVRTSMRIPLQTTKLHHACRMHRITR